MSSPLGVAPDTSASLVEAARRLWPRVRELADTTERERRLPAELVRAFAEAGVFRMCVPRRLGGGEVDAATLVGVVEELARADGAAAWCAMIAATSGVVSAYLSDEVAREIYGARPDVVSGGVFAPQGRARPEGGGYRVSGRWAFASGCEHSAWLMGGCLVLEDGVPRTLPGGAPDVRLMLFPAREAEVIDTWWVAGLRGTGSHDIAVTDLVVPAGRSVSLATDPPRAAGPLYAFPVFGLLALGIAAVALGIGRAAIEELVRLAAGKTPTLQRRRLAERAMVQAQVAEAEATLRGARALLLETVAETWAAAEATGTIPARQRALLRLAATHATTSAARATDLMYHAGGGSAVYATSPLQRCFRDVHTVTQHMMVGAATYELTGRLLLGLEADTSML
jgi:alkylation response protein AidB-like acyl-CoA dehydrogenase